MRNPRHRGRGSRVGTIIAAIGVLGVVGGSFGLGVFVGAHWSYFSIATGSLFSRHAPAPARETPDDRGRTEKSDPVPNLTFYQELTAPLSAPPPRAKEPPARDAAPAADVKPSPPAGAGDKGPFNVQIAAYKTREQAEALRMSLAARGITAYVSEMSTPSGPRYRVRVGPFDSRDAARENALALAADTGLGAFVTTDATAR